MEVIKMTKYINTEELIFYINKTKNGDSNSLEKIFEYLDRFLIGMTNKYYMPGVDNDDIIQIAKIGLYEGIQSFDENKTDNPIAFLKRCAETNIKDEIKKMNRDKHKTLGVACSLDVPLDKNDESSALLGDIIEDNFSVERFIEIKEIKKQINSIMTNLELNVLNLYMDGYSYMDISKILVLSKKQVENALIRARKKIKINKDLNQLYSNY